MKEQKDSSIQLKSADTLIDEARSMFEQSRLSDCRSYCQKILGYFEQENMTDQAARVYGLMGVIATRQDNEIQALDYYLKALDIKLYNHDNMAISKLYANIAVLYMILKDCDMSEECFELSEKYIELYKAEHGIDEAYIDWDVRLIINRSFQYCKLQNYSKAIQYKWRLNDYMECERTPFVKQFNHVLNAVIAYHLELFDDFISNIKLVIEYKMLVIPRYEIYEEYMELFRYLIEKKETELATEFISVIEVDEEIQESVLFMAQYYDGMMAYYQMIKDEEKLSDLYEMYFSQIQKRKADTMQSKLLNLQTKTQLHQEISERKQVEDEVKRLKEKSEHDALTGLANRYLFNEYCDKYFNESVKNHTTFGVLIIDVDYFKEYNDTFGHIQGDQCIKMVAECIEQAADGCFCARYGGDEFFIIASGITKLRLQKIATKIQKLVLEQKRPHPQNKAQPFVSVSQGICIASPSKGQSYMEFVHEADMALYRGKEMNRNAIVMGKL